MDQFDEHLYLIEYKVSLNQQYRYPFYV